MKKQKQTTDQQMKIKNGFKLKKTQKEEIKEEAMNRDCSMSLVRIIVITTLSLTIWTCWQY